MLSKNTNLFANSDMDLGQTNTVRMNLDIGNHAPISIRSKPYRIPLTKRIIIDKALAVDEMLMQWWLKGYNHFGHHPYCLCENKMVQISCV